METTASEQPKRIYTKLKFARSEQTGAYISFVSQNPISGRISGVRGDSVYPKKICIIDQKLAGLIIPDILYDSTLIPMKEKDGYIVIEVNPVAFRATVETTYVPKSIYKVEVRFGNKTVLFDPVDGKQESVSTISGVRGILEKRMDIKDLQQVIDDFLEHAYVLMKYYENDGAQFSKRKKRLRKP
jgi:hypothetical protein